MLFLLLLVLSITEDPEVQCECKPGLVCERVGKNWFCELPADDMLDAWGKVVENFTLSLSHSYLRGDVPDIATVAPNVEELDLSHNLQLGKGQLWPWLEALTMLKSLKLAASGRIGTMNAIDWSKLKDTLVFLDLKVVNLEHFLVWTFSFFDVLRV